MKSSIALMLISAVLPNAMVKAEALPIAPEIVHIQDHGRTLGGELYMPAGSGPFPAVLYNHGSAPGMLNSQASKIIGPLFASKGWIFFMPYRRGQGLSAGAGAYIGDEIDAARQHGGLKEASATMVRLLSTEQLDDQVAALQWLRSQSFVQPTRIAVAGNSFGGIEAVLGAASQPYCAAAVASGGAESWDDSPELQVVMKDAARRSDVPMLFFQAANDFSLEPSQAMLAARKQAGKRSDLKVYPAFGSSAAEGHSFAYRGSAVWFPDVYEFMRMQCPSHQ